MENVEKCYNFGFIPTYKMMDTAEECDLLFKVQFLQAFGLESDDANFSQINEILSELYARFKDHITIRNILENHPLHVQKPENKTTLQIMSEDGMGEDNDELLFCMMFSYETFDIFHKCLVELNIGQDVPESLKCELLETLNRMY
jgi:hypothetical protein